MDARTQSRWHTTEWQTFVNGFRRCLMIFDPVHRPEVTHPAARGPIAALARELHMEDHEFVGDGPLCALMMPSTADGVSPVVPCGYRPENHPETSQSGASLMDVLDRQAAELKSKLQRIDPETNRPEYDVLFNRLLLVEGRRREVIDAEARTIEGTL